uniref:helix-turn-helix domain-containing protein n=1 Tax=Nonomuraea lactucae TaxID=2249762 RepID=UPI0013B3BED7
MSEDHLDALALLHDPVRRSLYEAVAGSGGEVGRAEAAEAAGVSRTLAGHHLDKLVEAGLLESGFRRPERRGPGSGRPAKVYRRAEVERSVSLPPRDYGVLASVLAAVVDALGAEEQAEA